MLTNQPSRIVPPAVRLRVLFAGAGNQTSWLLLCLGMLVFWIVVFGVDLSFTAFWGARERATGTVTDSQETSVTVNDRAIFVTSYRFATADGRVFEDYSYSTGRWYGDGQKVTIEYPAGKPTLSRITGMRRKMFGPGFLWVLVVPVGSVAFFIYRMRKGLRALYLLRYGQLAQSTLVSKDPTNMSVNDQPVYKLTFAFTAQDGQEYQVSHTTHATAALEDEETERLLYDPAQPASALMVDTIPGFPALDEHGRLRPQPLPVAALVLPVLTLVGHGWYALASLF
jgi:hypothetical protein